MAYIVKSSLEIKPTILSTRDVEKLIKEKEEYLKANKKEVVNEVKEETTIVAPVEEVPVEETPVEEEEKPSKKNKKGGEK